MGCSGFLKMSLYIVLRLRRWLFETNYDHWGPVPANDDRRDPGINAILALGKENVDTDAVFQVRICGGLVAFRCLVCLVLVRASNRIESNRIESCGAVNPKGGRAQMKQRANA